MHIFKHTYIHSRPIYIHKYIITLMNGQIDEKTRTDTDKQIERKIDMLKIDTDAVKRKVDIQAAD